MYEQISEHTLYLMFYASVAVLNLTACLYLLLRRANAIAPDVTSPLRLRRWTAGFLGAAALSHLWYLPLLYLTSGEDIKMLYLVCALFDFLTVFPLAIVVLFTMLQDRRRPLWPVAVMMAPPRCRNGGVRSPAQRCPFAHAVCLLCFARYRHYNIYGTGDTAIRPLAARQLRRP